MAEPAPIHDEWNAQLALECVDGCEAELRDLFRIWLRQSPELLSSIRSALEHDDPENLQLAAHTLKGSLQILCADMACAYAAELETAGENRKTASAACVLPKLEVEIAHLTGLVNIWLNSP